MRRVVQKRIEDRLSDEILEGRILPGERVTVDINKEGEYSFRSDIATAIDRAYHAFNGACRGNFAAACVLLSP